MQRSVATSTRVLASKAIKARAAKFVVRAASDDTEVAPAAGSTVFYAGKVGGGTDRSATDHRRCYGHAYIKENEPHIREHACSADGVDADYDVVPAELHRG